MYTPAGIFNMDEMYFTLSDTRKVRRIGTPDHRASQAAPGRSGTGGEHITVITVIATVGIDAAPVSPLVIYKGKSLQGTTAPAEGDRHATVTDSGWTNSDITKQWLEKCFDPATRDRVPPGRLRLLFLDGADVHDKVDFLEACWERSIVVVVMPARLTFSPTNFSLWMSTSFNHVKSAYLL